jgi:hypothetical protein
MFFSEKALGGGKGRIPWTQLHQAQGDYVLQEYLPAGVTLTQYHHIRLGDANALLQHWTARQAAGLIPFRFKKVAKISQQSEPALRRREVPTNINHGNGEKDPDGIQAAQEQGSEHDQNLQEDGGDSDGNDAQGGGNVADDLGPSMVSVFSKRNQKRTLYTPVYFSIHCRTITSLLVTWGSQGVIGLPRGV